MAATYFDPAPRLCAAFLLLLVMVRRLGAQPAQDH
jgi:hypothetical protein